MPMSAIARHGELRQLKVGHSATLSLNVFHRVANPNGTLKGPSLYQQPRPNTTELIPKKRVDHFAESQPVERMHPGGGRVDKPTIHRPQPSQTKSQILSPVQYQTLAQSSSPIVRAAMTHKNRVDRPRENAADVLATYRSQQRAPQAKQQGNLLLHSLSRSGSLTLSDTEFVSKAQDTIDLHEQVTDFVRGQQAELRAKSASQPIRHTRPYRDITHDINPAASRETVSGLPYGIQYREVSTALRRSLAAGRSPQDAVQEISQQDSVQLARISLQSAQNRQAQVTGLDPLSLGGLEGNTLLPSELSSPLPGMHSPSYKGPVTNRGRLFSKTARFLPPPGEKSQRVDAPIGQATAEMYGATWLHKSPAAHDPADAFPSAPRAARNGAGIRVKLNSTRHRGMRAGMSISSPSSSFYSGSLSPVRTTLSVKKSFKLGVQNLQQHLNQTHLSAMDYAGFEEEAEAETKLVVAGGGFKVRVPRKVGNAANKPASRARIAAKQAALDGASPLSRPFVDTAASLTSASPRRRRRSSSASIHSLGHVPHKEVVYHGNAGFADRVVNSPAALGLLPDFQRRELGSAAPIEYSPGQSLSTVSHFSL